MSNAKTAFTPGFKEGKVVQETDFVLSVILSANLGPLRKFAQDGNCSEFAAALYDVLTENGIKAECWVAKGDSNFSGWAHCVVRVGYNFYDSTGLVSADAFSMRAKRPVGKIFFKEDGRYVSDEFAELHNDYKIKLGNALNKEKKKRWQR